MWMIIVGVVLLIGKLLEIGPIAEWSWWWVISPFIVALIWFEVFERPLGLDKKKASEDLEKEKEERIQRALGRDKAHRSRRA